MSVWRSHRALWLALLAYAIAYARTLGFGLVWDDQILTRPGGFQGPLSTLLRARQQALMDPAELELRGAQATYDSYRPLQTLSHLIDLRWLGGSPAIMHADSLVLGALAIVLAYLLLRRLVSERAAAFCTALFALHPLQVEIIAYVSARGDQLAAIAALAALWSAVRALESDDTCLRARLAWSLASLFAFLASLLAKEAYAGVPAIVLCLALARDQLRRALPVVAAHGLALVAYVALRVSAMGAISGKVGHAPWQALLRWPGVTLQYARTFVMPFDLSIERPLDTSLTLPGLLLVGALALASVLLVVRRELRATLGPFVAAYACALLLLGPAAAAATDVKVTADRYAYLAVIPFSYLVLRAYDSLHGVLLRRVLLAAAGIWAVSVALVQVQQVSTFRDNWALYLHAVAFEPGSPSAQYRVGYLAARHGDLPRAREYFEAALRLDPRYIKAHNNLGAVLLDLGDLPQAQVELERAIALAPELSYRAWYNLARVREKQGDLSGACKAAKTSSTINPVYEKARLAVHALCGAP